MIGSIAGRQDRKPNVRLRQLLWSAAAALVLWFLNTVGPLDQLIWVAQSRSMAIEPSGQIVFVGSERDLTDPDFPERRESLARAILNLKQAGVERIYVDEVFDRPSKRTSDSTLNAALRSMHGDAFLVSKLGLGIDGTLGLSESIHTVGSAIPDVGSDRKEKLFGMVWDVPAVLDHKNRRLTNVALSLADTLPSVVPYTVEINYGFNHSAIPVIDFDQVVNNAMNGEERTRLKGAQVVIGNRNTEGSVSIPGFVNVPFAMVHIYAAETLKAGFSPIAGSAVLAATFAFLLLAAFIKDRRKRLTLYSGVVLAYPTLLIIATVLGSRASIGAGLVLCAVYGAFRLRAKWMDELLLVDEATNLPTFAALETNVKIARSAPAIIVAKMHRFEEVRRTLPATLHGEYVLRIIERLRAASPETPIYLGPAHLLAWCMEERDHSLLKEHLEGMRALFAAPLQVNGQQVDVGMTFGIDTVTQSDVAKRLANAVSAAERTNETYAPIVVGEIDSDEEMLWNISLQARIDNALDNGEIYLNYQPKVLISTGEMIGVEALVRWRDPVKGMIPPDSFIRQCENTGRMSHVTKHVLVEACNAGNYLAALGGPLSIAVNISATMLHDRAIVAMVREVLQRTGFDPNYLTLEITETYRISDFAVANDILGELCALGAKVSMDDFGMGAASMEALLQLPFAELKIDRLFISQMMESPKALGIVRSILQLGRQLRTVVVAEGVEDDATLELLRDGGCRVAQGYGILRPASLEHIVQFRDRQGKSTALISG